MESRATAEYMGQSPFCLIAEQFAKGWPVWRRPYLYIRDVNNLKRSRIHLTSRYTHAVPGIHALITDLTEPVARAATWRMINTPESMCISLHSGIDPES